MPLIQVQIDLRGDNMQSKINIESIDYLLTIKTLDDVSSPNLIEKNLIPDPTDFYSNSSIIISSTRGRRKITLSGYCSNDDRLVIKGAYKLGQKVYPTLYAPNGSNNLTASSYYYITKFNTTYKIGNTSAWFDMEITYGGAS